jgi:hypothetical protein
MVQQFVWHEGKWNIPVDKEYLHMFHMKAFLMEEMSGKILQKIFWYYSFMQSNNLQNSGKPPSRRINARHEENMNRCQRETSYDIDAWLEDEQISSSSNASD